MLRSCLFLQITACSLIVLAAAGCSLRVQPTKSQTADLTYIDHYAPAEGETRLRLAVKDLIDMKGAVTTAGSEHFADLNQPASRDARLLRGARREDVIIVGKTNLTELALGTSGTNAHFGTPVNPVDPKRVPGGSSSGSAVAVANGSADVAIGTDTAGSIRVPAACCGIFGLKTTFGLISLDGVYPLSPRNLDTVGPMAADIPRLVQGMDLMVPGFSSNYARARSQHPAASGIRVARFYVKGTDRAIDRAIDAALQQAGFRIVRLNEDFTKAWERAKSNGNTIAVVDGWLTNRDLIGKPGIESTTSAALRLGAIQYPEPYGRALTERAAWRETLEAIFRQVDFIALPTLQSVPPRKPLIFRRTAFLETRMLAMQNTVPVNYAGNPAIAIPIPLPDQDFPVTSLQLIGTPNSEAELVNAARLAVGEKP